MAKMTKAEAILRNFIISQLRNSFKKFGVKYEVLREAMTEKKVNPATGRVAQHYRCAFCQEEFVQNSVQVDHKEAVVPTEGFVDWNTYIDRLFCSKENLQVLCKTCHQKKTNTENKERRARKKL